MDAEPSGTTRLERLLAYSVVACIGLSVLCFIAVLVGSAVGQGDAQLHGEGPWTALIMFPYFGLSLGMVFVIILIVTSAARRKRATSTTDA
ncbi:MAG TPA: hypothetical protein VK139_04190 [Microbacteriaceae bacterium]|nr:hypothetical protein [Microbacteriaceae bacterium]